MLLIRRGLVSLDTENEMSLTGGLYLKGKRPRYVYISIYFKTLFGVDPLKNFAM